LISSIIKETNVPEEVAKEIATKTREKLGDLAVTMGWTSVSTSLIREIVEQELMNKGKRYTDRAKKYRTLGLSENEITRIIENEGSRDNGNLGHNPDAVLFVCAETMIKQYALKHVFPSEVVEGHLQGDINLHDLGQVHKVYCGSHSVEYIKKNGLNLNTVLSKSKPAKSASVLVNHMLTFSATIQNQFAGAVGFDAVNVFFAPYFVNKTYKQMKQVAQELFFGFSQSAFSRGGQSLFSDLNFYLTVPPQYVDSKAIGPGGHYVKLSKIAEGSVAEYELKNCKKEEASTYKEFEPWAQMFVKAVLETMEEGDSSGMPFAFPKGDFHIDKKAFLPENKWILDCLARAVSVNGSPYMIFDRGDGWKISQCCRLQKEFGEGDKVLAKERPEDVRFQAIQNITLNLPRIGYKYQQSRTEQGQIDPMDFVKKEIDRLLELCLTAHKAKKKYIKKLMSLDTSPLHLLKYGMDGKGYMDIEKVVYLVGLLGLNEMVQAITGKELHESDAAFDFGMKAIAYLSLRVKEIGEKEGMGIVLEESPAESTSKRLAKLDDYYYNGAAAKYIRGNKETGAIYYTNCVSEDTEVMTEDGWKGIDDVSAGTKVLTMDMNDKKTYYQPVIRKYEQTLKKAKMVSIKGKMTDQLITPNHNVLYTNLAKKHLVNLTTYKNLPSAFRVFCAAPIANEDNPKYSDDMLALLGWIISEGHYGKTDNFMTIAQSEVANKKKYDEIDSLLKRLGFDYQINFCKERGPIAFRLKKADYLEVKRYFPEKRIPREILNTCSVRQLRILLDTALKGDGTRHFNVKTKSWNEQATYYSSDIGIIEDVQEAMLKIGYRANVLDCPSSVCYQVQFTRFNTTEISAKKNISEVEYTGRVWCVEVDNHTFVARRKGKVFITGNSVHMREDCGIDFIERIRKQSKFHAMVSGGSIIHLWVGENLPSPEAVTTLMQKTFSKTRCTQLTVSPEFTLCEKCLVNSLGLKNKCPKCGNDDLSTLTQITRVVGYFSRVSNWVDSKKEELAHRQHDFALEAK
jgi:anaerobic ribonucleoside-triphosphate reductase